MDATTAVDTGGDIELGGVPETMLWPLWNRAGHVEAGGKLLSDPMALELVRSMDYDFRARFGKPSAPHVVRARYSDELIRDFLARHPDAPVIALGEGLETQFWRVDNGRVRWFSIDLPEATAVRRRHLPAHPRNTLVGCSALDTQWFARVPADGPVFVSAAGLFMYFERNAVVILLRSMVRHFRRGELFFDTIPPWLSRRSQKGWAVTRHYTAPPMPFGIALERLPDLFRQVSGLTPLKAQTYAEPYPQAMPFFALVSRVRWLKRNIAPALVHARFP